jgi:hypothetical protein
MSHHQGDDDSVNTEDDQDTACLAEFRRISQTIADTDAKRERLRVEAEPPPEECGEFYVPLVAEVKRLAIEFDAIEMPGAFSKERNDKLKKDVRNVGMALHKLNGVGFMRLTLDLYVSKSGGLHRCFDAGWDGIGDWAW